MLDLNRLRVFQAVVASGSVQAAASHLGYTPSAVSQQLSTLQRETGLALFEKSGRGIAPTPAGRTLAAQSEALMTSHARLAGVIDDLRVGRTGSLSIGCFASAAQAWMPRVAKRLHEEFPDVLVHLDLNEMSGHQDPRGTDLEVRTETVDEETSLPGYTRYVLHQESYVVLLPAAHPGVGREEIALADLADEAWIEEDPGEGICGRILRAAYTAAGYSPRYVARTQDHYTAAALVAAGVGVTAVPRLAAGLLPDGVVARRLVRPEPMRRIVAFVRDSTGSSRPSARAVHLLRAVAADHDPLS